jgi:hypothetical protein
MPPIPRRTKLDREQEAHRARMLKQAEKEYKMHHAKLLKDNFARLLAITDEEWKEAVDEEGEEA